MKSEHWAASPQPPGRTALGNAGKNGNYWGKRGRDEASGHGREGRKSCRDKSNYLSLWEVKFPGLFTLVMRGKKMGYRLENREGQQDNSAKALDGPGRDESTAFPSAFQNPGMVWIGNVLKAPPVPGTLPTARAAPAAPLWPLGMLERLQSTLESLPKEHP